MILQSLVAYYEELLAQGKISAPGWDDTFKVSFQLELDDTGALIDVIDVRELMPVGKKQLLRPTAMQVPAHKLRSSGISANFLCDNTTYLLGADDKGKPERAKSCFAACAALHHQLLDGVDDPAARAILAYFDSWKPEYTRAHPLLKDRWEALTANANLVFCYDGEAGRRPVTENPKIRAAWQQAYQAESPETVYARCLVTGQVAPMAATHPMLKGIRGAQSSGASLVSFNAPAFWSYGHEHAENAPVSEYAAFAYTTALNALLADREHCKTIGDSTVVCWAENAGTASADLGICALFGTAENTGVQDEDLKKSLALLAQGKPCEWLGETLLPEQHINYLGLAPNAARVSVRFYLRDTLAHFAAHIRAHQAALEIVNGWPAFSIWALARETVRRKSDGKYEDPAPQLAGDILRAVLSGGRYPATLLNGVMLRIRAEHDVTRGKAAILKAYYTRNHAPQCPKEVLTVELNEQCSYQPYVLGRLFAVLEMIQSDANPGIDATIKDRYFNSVCATPNVIFPTLLKLAQKHLKKIERDRPALFRRDQTQLCELMGRLTAELPAHMTLPEQGAFTIGYYHQTQKRYEKKNKEEISNA